MVPLACDCSRVYTTAHTIEIKAEKEEVESMQTRNLPECLEAARVCICVCS